MKFPEIFSSKGVTNIFVYLNENCLFLLCEIIFVAVDVLVIEQSYSFVVIPMSNPSVVIIHME